MVQGGPFEISGFLRVEGGIAALDLEEASAALKQVIEGVDLGERVPKTGLEAGDVAIVPGESSSSPTVKVWLRGAWVHYEASKASSAPLDEISRHALDSKKLMEFAKADLGLVKMLKVFLMGDLSEIERPKLTGMPRKTSRGFSTRDVEMLKSAGVRHR